jgi:hypothetical protein
MDRRFDYAQKISLAVEFAEAPRQLAGMPRDMRGSSGSLSPM